MDEKLKLKGKNNKKFMNNTRWQNNRRKSGKIYLNYGFEWQKLKKGLDIADIKKFHYALQIKSFVRRTNCWSL